MPHWFAHLALAAQEPAAQASPADPELWPYIAVIGSLASTVVALFGWLMKVQKDAAVEKAQIHKDNRSLIEARSLRVANEFDKERKERNEQGEKWSESQGRVAQALEQLADAVRENGGMQDDTVRQVAELHDWFKKNDDVLVYLRRDLEKDLKTTKAIVMRMARAAREDTSGN